MKEAHDEKDVQIGPRWAEMATNMSSRPFYHPANQCFRLLHGTYTCTVQFAFENENWNCSAERLVLLSHSTESTNTSSIMSPASSKHHTIEFGHKAKKFPVREASLVTFFYPAPGEEELENIQASWFSGCLFWPAAGFLVRSLHAAHATCQHLVDFPAMISAF